MSQQKRSYQFHLRWCAISTPEHDITAHKNPLARNCFPRANNGRLGGGERIRPRLALRGTRHPKQRLFDEGGGNRYLVPLGRG